MTPKASCAFLTKERRQQTMNNTSRVYKNSAQAETTHCYSISCSNLSNSGESKKSLREMFTPSQIIFMVAILGFLLLPYRMFLIDDGGKPASVANALMVKSFSSHSLNIRFFIALHNGDCVSAIAYYPILSDYPIYRIVDFSPLYRLRILLLGYT